jgi:hypothetical protein
MTHLQQCGLCLSCAGPFMPRGDEVDLFNQKGNMSVLFLNGQFKDNADIRRQYEYPKYAGQRQASHVYHDSHHQCAIDYMCNHHTGDERVWWFIENPALHEVIQALPNYPLPYYRTPKGKRKGPMAATWRPPPAQHRLNFRPLQAGVINGANAASARPVLQNLDERLALCSGCNLIMTQQNNMDFHLGLSKMLSSNTDPIIKDRPITQWKANDRRMDQPHAFGHWTRAPGAGVTYPRGAAADDLTPSVAYYLHMCLPLVDAANPDPFQVDVRDANLRPHARRLYLELCWLILEIACVATLRERGKLYAPLGARSHGPQQHAGALDLYVSYFIFRLMLFEHGEHVRREGLDFIQWHQKYFWDAINCPGLFPEPLISGLLGATVCTTTTQPSRGLVENVCNSLMDMYNHRLDPLIRFVTNQQAGLPRSVSGYFLPLPAMRELRTRSGRQVVFGFVFIPVFRELDVLFNSIFRCWTAISTRRSTASGPAPSCSARSSCAGTVPSRSGASSTTSARTGSGSSWSASARAAST